MIRKISLLLTCAFCSIFITQAQKINGGSNKVQKYYQHINRAELDIIDTNYSSALAEYHKAFTLKYPNGKDLYNAFVVSYYLKDTSNAYKFYNWLAYHGMKRGYFSDSASNPYFYKYLTLSHDSSRAVGYSDVDAGAVEFWDIVDEFTKKYRKYSPEYFMNEKEFKQKAKEMDNLNRENILGYINGGGLYSFKDIGFWTKNSSPHSSNSPFYDHVYYTKSYDHNLNDFYKQLCLDGSLNIMDFVSLYTRSLKITKGFKKRYGLDLYNRDIDNMNLSKINERRKELFLATVSDYYKRKKYDNWHKISSGVWERNMFVFFTGYR